MRASPTRVRFMKFIVKLFPEITIKSKPVRKQFIRQLRDNLRTLLKPVSGEIGVQRDWDKITVDAPQLTETQQADVVEILSHTPGIAYFLEVLEFPLGDMQDVYQKTADMYVPLLAGKTFAVRCKRAGKHDFTSNDIERYVGGGLNQYSQALGVNLTHPDITVLLEIRDDRLFVVKQRHKGLGGFPLGGLDPVLSLISGGFDSPVASYLTMKRGMRTHFCFFNLGGRAHEVGVKEIALYLWMKFGASHRVKFIAVPFEEVVSEILQNVDNSQMGVVLKRMMLRASSELAAQLGVQALVTGESIAQVSSQTLANLAVIDSVCDMLVLRPLVTADKTDIINTARQIGTETFAANMPEYCGVISVKPTTRAKPEKILAQEQCFDFSVLERAIANARSWNIDELALDETQAQDVEVISVPVQDSIIIDIRHPDEQHRKVLDLHGVKVVSIPFYQLHKAFVELERDRQYFLYCEKGVMSRLHAAHLVEDGFKNVGVYRP